MFDAPDAAELDCDLEAATSIDDFLADSEPVVDSDLENWLAREGAAVRDPALDPILFGSAETRGDPQARFAVVPSNTRRMHWLIAELSRTLAPDEAIFCVELPANQAIEYHNDPQWLVTMLRRYASLVRLARPESRFGKGERVSLQFEPTRASIHLLIGVVTRGEPLKASRLRIARLHPARGWQLATFERGDGIPSNVRRVELGGVTRPCLALGGRGRIRAEVDVGPREPRLSLALGMLWQDVPARVQVRGTVVGERATVTFDQTLEIGPNQFQAYSRSLREVAGQRARLDLEVVAVTRRAESVLLLAEPVIESLLDAATAPPDVVVISLDTTRADRLSLHGGARPTTPAIDRFAASAVVFDSAISAASWTLPSHTTMFTGEYPDRHGVYGSSSLLLSDTAWLPEILRERGYETAAYTGGGYLEPVFGHARGYDRYGTIDVAFPPRAWAQQVADPSQIEAAVRSEAERSELLARIGEPRRRPLFLFVHTYVVHNYAAAPAALRAIGVAEADLASLVIRTDRKGMSRAYRSAASSSSERDELRRRADLIYDATLFDADRMVDEILEALRRSGRLEQAIVVVLSDHGEEIFDRGDIGHGQSVYEEQIRVPWIVKAPGLAPRRIRDLVSLVDLTPTLLDLLGLPALLDRADGRSLAPLLRGATLAPVPVLSRGDRGSTEFRSLRGIAQKVIENKLIGGAGTYELYDLAGDPNETRDLASTRAGDAQRLAAILTGTVRSLEKLRGRTGSLELSSELTDELRELGYLGGER